MASASDSQEESLCEGLLVVAACMLVLMTVSVDVSADLDSSLQGVEADPCSGSSRVRLLLSRTVEIRGGGGGGVFFCFRFPDLILRKPGRLERNDVDRRRAFSARLSLLPGFVLARVLLLLDRKEAIEISPWPSSLITSD